MALSICQESYVCEPDASYRLYICAKRYQLKDYNNGNHRHHDDSEALAISIPATLIFLHSTSFHKETWEPTISSLLELLTGNQDALAQQTSVQDIWAIDCPNHGQSATLNQVALQQPEFLGQCECISSI